MGIIKNEGLKQSIVTYLGVLIGAINTLYIYPRFLQVEELGLFSFLKDTALLLFPFISLGVHNLSVRMFPTFKNDTNGHNGLLFFLLAGVSFGYVVFLGFVVLGRSFIVDYLSLRSVLIQQYWYYLIPLGGLTVLGMVLTQWLWNFKKTVLPQIVNDIYVKVGTPIIVLLYYFDVFTLPQSVLVLVLLYVFRVVSLLLYIRILKEWHLRPNWSFLTPMVKKEMYTYSSYGLLGGLGSVLATSIDTFMMAMLAVGGLKSVGIYSVALFITNVITVPARAISSIASPIIAESNANNDTANIEMIYKKSSIILLTIGSFFLLGIWSSVDDLFSLMPKGDQFAAGKYVILILGLGKLFDLATGVNSQIISYSKYFRFNFYAVLILAVVNIVANYLLIPKYQINGAALATAMSLVLFNASKYIYIKQKMGMQPFTIATLKLLSIVMFVYLAGAVVPSLGHALTDLLVRSLAITVLFGLSIYYVKVSLDINELVDQILGRVGLKMPKR